MFIELYCRWLECGSGKRLTGKTGK